MDSGHMVLAISSVHRQDPPTQEFDAGILINEFNRYLPAESAWFAKFVRMGLCTMDPHVGRWLYQMQGIGMRADESMPSWNMKNLVLYLIPEDAPLLENHHSAGTDAQLHRKLGYALCGLAVAPCRMEGNNHEFLEVTHTQRATGARKCSRCSEWLSQSSQ